MKRALFHFRFQELKEIECEALGKPFQEQLISYFKNPQEESFSVGSLDLLREKLNHL